MVDLEMIDWVIRIPESLPSLNETQRRSYRFDGKNNRRRWAQMIMAQVAVSGITEAVGKRRVVIERHARRRFDSDNMHGGVKGFVDELRAFKLLVNDSPKWLDLVTIHVPLTSGETTYTKIRIMDVDDV